ncbi:MAG: hypothetical protein A3E01_15395 [Gammaproteobacteria bacterium RIFCSPHIGHO2_12_FULL_63_22]|nr:MAG: hypothetical protein A3E01_15395 [Gammaproteobacteria bacterium RIFCSPHIGHO2_12_FULL_63_22]
MKTYIVESFYTRSDGSVDPAPRFLPLSRSRSTVEQDVLRDSSGAVKRVDNNRVGPWGDTTQPVTVELEDDEAAFLRKLPGHGLHQHWSFEVSEV